MIIDLKKFISEEQPFWDELEHMLNRLAQDHAAQLSISELRRFHYLYERVSADLARITTFSAEPETRIYLETMVARAYAEIHETREKGYTIRPLHWFFVLLPQTFRAHIRAFILSCLITLAGTMIGGLVIGFTPSARDEIFNMSHLSINPSERVNREEHAETDTMKGRKTQGAAWYMTHNTQVAINTMAAGATWGIGTILLLFYNGFILGAVFTDYIANGQTAFVFGWLLPHGSVEIPALLIAGQTGLVLAGTIIGWGRKLTLRRRMRIIAPQLVTLIGGTALLLVWAGIIESFLSQYHEPVIPYSLKIMLGLIQIALLALLLIRGGRSTAAKGGDV